jgi:hypothetical protein
MLRFKLIYLINEAFMKTNKITLILISIVTFFSFPSFAEENQKTYVSFGMMNMTDEGLDVLKGSGVSVDDSSTVGNLTIGYKVTPSLSIEGAVIAGGEVSASIPSGDSGTLYGKSYSVNGVATIKAETEAYLLGLKYSGGNGPLSINVKVGQLFWDVDYTASLNGTVTYAGTSYSVSSSVKILSEDGNDPYMGIGASYALKNGSFIELDFISTEIHDTDVSGYGLSWVRKF